MKELTALYTECAPDSCSGCSVLSQRKPFYASMDFDMLEEADVLFVSDSYKYKNGGEEAFTSREYYLISQATHNYSNYSQEYIPSIRCPSVKEADITANDMKLCRKYLEESINRVKPKLIFACGNLAMRMLLKKSGMGNKRGETFPLKLDSGHECLVMPIYHPLAAILEPQRATLFFADIKRAYDKVILGKTVELDLKYKLVRNLEELREFNWLLTTNKNISIDLETEGLDCFEDKILTIGICWGDESLIIPLFHKEQVWTNLQLGAIEAFLEDLLLNPNNDKIFHNAKFDLKYYS